MTDTAAPPKPAAAPAQRSTSAARWLYEALGGAQNISLIGALIAVLVVFGSLNSGYLTRDNLAVIGQLVAIFGVLAVVQTVVILHGAIDISVGSQTGLAAVVCAIVFARTGDGIAGGSALLGIAAAIGVGAIAGLINGLIIVYGRVNAIIATLAMLATYKGVAQLITDGRAQGYLLGDDLFIFISRGSILGAPTMLWILLAVALAVHILLKFTDIGRNVYAIGGNATAARLAGININKYLISAYVLVGVVAAIAGIMLAARTASAHPTAGSEGLELRAITAAFLGGCAIAGGRGGIGGTMLAVSILGALENGLTVEGVSSFWQNVAVGTLLVVAVVIQQRRIGERAVGLPT